MFMYLDKDELRAVKNLQEKETRKRAKGVPKLGVPFVWQIELPVPVPVSVPVAQVVPCLTSKPDDMATSSNSKGYQPADIRFYEEDDEDDEQIPKALIMPESDLCIPL